MTALPALELVFLAVTLNICGECLGLQYAEHLP